MQIQPNMTICLSPTGEKSCGFRCPNTPIYAILTLFTIISKHRHLQNRSVAWKKSEIGGWCVLKIEVFFRSGQRNTLILSACVAPGTVAFRGALQRGALPLFVSFADKSTPAGPPALHPPGSSGPLDPALAFARFISPFLSTLLDERRRYPGLRCCRGC